MQKLLDTTLLVLGSVWKLSPTGWFEYNHDAGFPDANAPVGSGWMIQIEISHNPAADALAVLLGLNSEHTQYDQCLFKNM